MVCAYTCCYGRWETTPLLPGVQVHSLRKPACGAACCLLPSSVQVLPVFIPPASATLLLYRRSSLPRGNLAVMFPHRLILQEEQGKVRERQARNLLTWPKNLSGS